MRAVGIADGDMRTHRAGNPLRAGHQRQHQPHAAQMGHDALGTRGIGIGNPHVDFDFVVELVGQGISSTSAGKTGEEFRGNCCGISDS